MGVLGVVLSVAKPLSLVVALSVWLSWVIIKSSAPSFHLEGILGEILTSPIKRVDTRQGTQLRVVTILAVCLFFASTIIQRVVPEHDIVPPSKPRMPKIVELKCGEMVDGQSQMLVKVSFDPVTDMGRTFRMFVRASKRRITFLSRVIGEIEVTSPSEPSAEFFIDDRNATKQVYVRIVFEDLWGRVHQRSKPAFERIESNC